MDRAEGEIVSVHEDPTDYCKALRQVLEASSTSERLKALWNRNAVTIEMLRANLPDLRTEPGEHYADVLLRLYRSHLKELHEEQEADQAEAEAIQKAAAAARADQQVDQAKVGELEGATQARKSDPCVGHGNGSQVQDEAVQKVGRNGNSQGANGTGTAG